MVFIACLVNLLKALKYI